ncbi:hypothetical protein HID58_036041 [Brassica napus]|uniref:F-box domain-containing protein n=1 Tax=Brassica napus TaxID=3708 RepID=A0ABQ8C6P6_BRANA|nr:hypothetical protein HID58_036041 [Brassica napus]
MKEKKGEATSTTSSSSAANTSEPSTKKKPSMIPDWSLLPGELLDVIPKNLDNCFDVLHARSVCTSWRSSFPFPNRLLTRPTYSLP